MPTDYKSSMIEDILLALDDDVRASVAPALCMYGPKACVRDWFMNAANDRSTPDDRLTYAKWACQVIEAAVKTRHTF